MPRLLPFLSKLLRRVRDARGFGLIELTIALAILSIAVVSLTGVYVASHLTLRRASQSDAAAVLSDRLLERFRSQSWDNIALNSTQVATAMLDTGSNGYNGPGSPLSDAYLQSASLAEDITEANAPLAYNGTASATDCTNSSEPVTCYPSRQIPDASQTPTEVAPDGKSYRLDAYVTWGCPDAGSETLGGTMSAPTCTNDADSTVLPYAPVKVVTVIVRDATTLASVYRTSTTFDRLGGGSMPTVTVTPTGTVSGGSGSPPPVVSVPNPPDSVSFVNGTGSGSPCPCITSSNKGSLSFDVQLPSTSLASDQVTLSLTDGNPDDTVTYSLNATDGAGIVHFTAVNDANTAVSGHELADGPITISATSSNSSGLSDPTTSTTTKDTTAPTGLSVVSPAESASGFPTTGPFTGTAGFDFANGDRSTVTVQFCKASTWTCGSSPTQTATANVDSSGNWSLSLSGGAKLTNGKSYTMRIVQSDAAGNTATSGDRHFST
ncbi:MAG TPA: prepilin-type N-terminal cleavage/methylation domain-containing protein [Gaiellaceae bacterium]|nr:prepilin-type N-terminal cleavage/methylation domain-containing protein [Gaiellaceae bacterium]